AAVGIGVLAQETSWQGSDNSGRFRVTLVTVQAGEGWRLAHVHIGPLQAPPGRPSGAGRSRPRGGRVRGAFPPTVVAADEGKTVMQFGVRFGDKVVSGDSGGRLAVLEVDPRARA